MSDSRKAFAQPSLIDRDPDGLKNEAKLEMGRRRFLATLGSIAAASSLNLWPAWARAAGFLPDTAFWRKRNLSGLGPSGYPAISGADPYWDHVVALLNMDMANGIADTVFADDSTFGRQTGNGSIPMLDSAPGSSPYPGKLGSAVFNGSTAYLMFSNSPDLALGSADFTIEFWFKPLSLSGIQVLASQGYTGFSESAAWQLFVNGTFKFQVWYGSGTSTLTLDSGVTPSMGTWNHVAVERSASMLRFYFNGSLTQTAGFSDNIVSRTSPVTIGSAQGYQNYNGAMVDFRLYVGAAKYAANFTPRTSPLGLGTSNDKHWGYCVLACPLSSSLKDMSGKKVTPSGNARLSAASKKSGNASAMFSAGDYIQVGAAGDFAYTIGTLDATLECWVNFNALPSSGFLCGLRDDTSQRFFALEFTSGQFYGRLTQDDSTFIDVQGGAATLGQWHHVALVRAGKGLLLFVDGLMVASRNDSVKPVIFSSSARFLCGSNLGSSAIQGSLDSVRLTIGKARYQIGPYAPGGAFPGTKEWAWDPYWSHTVLAMRFEDGSDATARHPQASLVGNIHFVTSSAAPMEAAGKNIQFDGSAGSYLALPASNDFQLGKLDFTIDFWARYTGDSTTTRHLLVSSDANSYPGLRISVVNGELRLYASGTGTGWDIAAGVALGSAGSGEWNHWAISRQGGNFLFFRNGFQISALGSSSEIAYVPGRLLIGSNGVSEAGFQGNLDDLRITRGVVRFAKNFMPPSRAFATTGSGGGGSAQLITSGLVCSLDAGEVSNPGVWSNIVSSPADGSLSSAYDLVQGDGVNSSTFPTFFGVSGGRSANDYFQFDGGDGFRLQAANNPGFLSALHGCQQDFTIQTWFYLATVSTQQYLLGTASLMGTSHGISLSLNTTGQAHFSVNFGSYSSGIVSSAVKLLPGYNFVAVTFSAGESRTARLYVNGLQANAVSALDNSDNVPASYRFQVGMDPSGSNLYPMSAGSRIYALQIYNRTLTKAELDQNVNAIRGRFGI